LTALDQLVTGLVITIFATPGAALILSGIIFASCAALIFRTEFSVVSPLVGALLKRIEALPRALFSGDPTQARAAFAKNQEAISLAMNQWARPDYPLQRAWLDYQQSFVELEPGVYSSSARAGDFFVGAGDPGRALDWWANIFVAVGLMFTFLGIVAALGQATSAIGSGGDATVMQGALATLLGIAAAKFWTSIAGIGSSLLLRVYARRWRRRLESLEEELCSALDAGVHHISPQAIAAMQLAELRKIAVSLQSGQDGESLPNARPNLSLIQTGAPDVRP
jgi:hypothetical protein